MSIIIIIKRAVLTASRGNGRIACVGCGEEGGAKHPSVSSSTFGRQRGRGDRVVVNNVRDADDAPTVAARAAHVERSLPVKKRTRQKW